MWCLHGVRVPQWLAETRDTDIDPKRILELDNAEQRREFVRKVGLERIYYKLGGKVIEVKHIDYRLLDGLPLQCLYKLFDLKYCENVIRRALQIDNPSLPYFVHFEYLPLFFNTV